SQTAKLSNDISTYTQLETESLYEAWERYKELLRRCPRHGLPTWLQVQTFYNGLIHRHKAMIDAAAGGTLNNKTLEAAYELIDEMATNSYQWQVDRAATKKQAGVHNVDAITALAAQIELLNKKIDGMSVGNVMMCELCGVNGHKSIDCQAGNPFSQPMEQVDYAGNFQRPPQNNPYSNTYNPGWRNHPNFSWTNQQNLRPPPPGYNQTHPPQQQQQKPSLEDLMSKFISTSEARFQNQDASIKNLETQIGQLAKMMTERTQGASSSNAEPKLKEHVKAITLRSGKELPNKQVKNKNKELETQEKLVEHQSEAKEKNKSKLFADEVIKEYKPRIPYPQKPKQEKLKEQYGKFLDLFKQLILTCHSSMR